MARYIVTYDLRADVRNYSNLYDRIKSYGVWAHITESSWAIETDQTAAAVADHLSQALDSNDKIFVGKLARPAAWAGLPDAVSDWLKRPQ